MVALVNLPQQCATLRQQLDVAAPTVLGVGTTADEPFVFQLLHLPRDGRRIDAELAGEVHDSNVGVGDDQEPQESEPRGRHPGQARKPDNEDLVGTEYLSQEVRLVTPVVRLLEPGSLLPHHVDIVA